MSIRDCLRNAGISDPQMVDKVSKWYQDGIDMDGLTSAQSRQKLMKRLEREALVGERRGMMNLQAQKNIIKQQETTTDWRGKKNSSLWIRGVLSDKTGQHYDDAANTKDGILRIWQAPIAEAIYALRPGWAMGKGRLKQSDVKQYSDDLLQAVFGEQITGPNKELAAMGRVIQELRKRMAGERNYVRGNLGLGSYSGKGLAPQLDVRKIENIKVDEYVQDAVDSVDYKEMFNPKTGAAFTEREAREMFAESYEAKKTRGASEVDYIPGKDPGGPSSIKYPDERYWVWKGSKGFKKFNEKYGTADLMELLYAEMESSATEVAFGRVLGPDWERNWEWGNKRLQNTLKKLKGRPETPEDITREYGTRLERVVAKQSDAAKRAAKKIIDIQKELIPLRKSVFALVNEKKSGKYAALREAEARLHAQEDILRKELPYMKDATQTTARFELEEIFAEGPTLQERVKKDNYEFAKREKEKAGGLFRFVENSIQNNGYDRSRYWGQTARSALSSSMLTGAAVVSTTDMATQMGLRASNGLSQASLIGQSLSQLSAADRKYSISAGLGFDRMGEMMVNNARWALDVNGKEFAGKLATTTLSLSGLLGWTKLQKDILGHEIANATAQNIKKSWAKLDAPLRNMYKRAGFTETDWKKLQTVTPSQYRGHAGANQITAVDIDKVSTDLAYKYAKMIRREQYFSTPEPDARIRSQMFKHADGTGLVGEIKKGFLMLKSFPVTIFMDQMTLMLRNLGEHGGTRAGIIMAGTAFMGAMLGAMAIWNRHLINGREPNMSEDIRNPEFWVAALMQGSGIGIVGDMVMSLNGVSRFNRGFGHFVMGAGFGKAEKMLEYIIRGDLTKVMRELGNAVPVAGVWWARPVTSQLITDVIEAAFDPKSARKNRRFREKFWKSEFGVERWSKEGRFLPYLGLD